MSLWQVLCLWAAAKLTPDKMASYTEGLHLSYNVSQLHLVKFYKTAEPLLQLTNTKRHNPPFPWTPIHLKHRDILKKLSKMWKKNPRWVCTTASNMEQSESLLRSILPVLNLVCHLTSVLLTWESQISYWPRKHQKIYILNLTTNKPVYLLTDVLSTWVSLLFLADICGSEKLWKTWN